MIPLALPKKSYVNQGEFRVSSDPTAFFSTVLGSCVSVCIFDLQKSIGGMNHFLLPHSPLCETSSLRYGANSMELLINGLIKTGADRNDLCAKAFGGARMNSKLGDIGQENSNFVFDYLSDEGIPLISHSFGGDSARKVEFWPTTGRARQLIICRDIDHNLLPSELGHLPETAAEVDFFK